MRAVFTLIFAIMISFSSQAQFPVGQKPERDVPVIVISVFNDQFPSNDPVWFSSYQGRYGQQLVYEARFIFANRYSSAYYGKDGNFIALASAVDFNEIPVKIREYMMQNFPGFTILEAIFVTTGKDSNTYEIGIMVDNQYVIKVFSQNGEFIKSVRP